VFPVSFDRLSLGSPNTRSQIIWSSRQLEDVYKIIVFSAFSIGRQFFEVLLTASSIQDIHIFLGCACSKTSRNSLIRAALNGFSDSLTLPR
jgi:hypothetical protein